MKSTEERLEDVEDDRQARERLVAPIPVIASSWDTQWPSSTLDIVTSSWETQGGSPLADIQEAARRAREETGWQPSPPVLYVSSDRYARLLEQGYIHADGTLTPLGKECRMPASVEAIGDVEGGSQ